MLLSTSNKKNVKKKISICVSSVPLCFSFNFSLYKLLLLACTLHCLLTACATCSCVLLLLFFFVLSQVQHLSQPFFDDIKGKMCCSLKNHKHKLQSDEPFLFFWFHWLSFTSCTCLIEFNRFWFVFCATKRKKKIFCFIPWI